jgi:hypothetical protein
MHNQKIIKDFSLTFSQLLIKEKHEILVCLKKKSSSFQLSDLESNLKNKEKLISIQKKSTLCPKGHSL